MKRIVRIIITMVLLVSFCAAPMAALAQSVPRQTTVIDPEALQITYLNVSVEPRNVVMRMTFQNDGNISIDEFGIALAFYNNDGTQVYSNTNTQEGYIQEESNWYYTPDEVIKPGDTYKTEDVFADYGGAVGIAVAVRYYHQYNGEYILIPESEWLWILPGSVTVVPEYHRSYYTEPSNAVYNLCNTINLGYRYYLLDDYNAAYYGMNQGGEWITSVTPDSMAEAAGLQAGDLILFVNGMKPTENVYAVEYGLAEIASGETIEWVYQRDELIYTTKMSAP